MDTYRAKKYWNQDEFIALDHRRRKSWTKGHEGYKYVVLNIRALVLETDVRILNKIKLKLERYNSYNNNKSDKLKFDNASAFPAQLRGNLKYKGFGKSTKNLYLGKYAWFMFKSYMNIIDLIQDQKMTVKLMV